jgi:kynureninase
MTDTHPTAEQLDADDPLATWRDEFLFTEPGRIYLDGNSLGVTPLRTLPAIASVVEQQWAGDLIESWWKHGWLDLPLTVGDELAPIVGARPGEVVVHESTTIALFQLVNVALDLALTRRAGAAGGSGPGRDEAVIAVDPGDFPTDRYVCDGIARLRGCTVRPGVVDLDGVDVVVRSLVDYRTSEVADLAAETARAAAAGVTIVWDLSHAAGVLAVDLTAAGAELAVGCSYKFLNGGPGAPAFAYVREALHDHIVQPIWGWFGQAEQFAMERPFEPRPGIARLLNGTPSVIALTAARSGYAVTREAGIAAIEAKARRLTAFATDLALALALDVASPLDPARRGGHVAIRHPDSVRIHEELGRRRVVIDRRDPDILRFGLSPLTTRFVDVDVALRALAALA